MEDKTATTIEFSLNQIPTHGVREDVESLIQKTVELFDDSATLRIAHFTQIWRSMKFGLIFHGRQHYRELYEFIEDLFTIVKSYTAKEHKMGTRAAAFYLLYALYNKQPTWPMVKIRVSLEEYRDLSQWMQSCIEERHLELAYCWFSLILGHAFVYVGSTKFLGLEYAGVHDKRNPLLVRESKIATTRDEPLYKESSFRNLLEGIRKSHDKYTQMKRALQSGNPALDSGFSIASDSFIDQIEQMCQISQNMTDGNVGNTLEVEGVSIGDRRKKIIEKSFGINATDHDDLDDDSDLAAPKGKGKGKGKSSKGKSVEETSERPGDLKTLAKSLAAVKEDPSLLLGLNEDHDIVLAKKRLKAAEKGPKKKKKE